MSPWSKVEDEENRDWIPVIDFEPTVITYTCVQYKMLKAMQGVIWSLSDPR